MQKKPLNMAAFLALAQHEVQKAIEYLAQPEVRVQSPEAPAQVFAQVGTVKMSVPVRFVIGSEKGRAPRSPKSDVPLIDGEGVAAVVRTGARKGKEAPQRDPREVLQPGMPWPPGGRPQLHYHLHVSTVGGCAEEGACGPVGKIEIEFITCLKQ